MFKLEEKEIIFLLGNRNIKKSIFQPFDTEICEFLSQLSQNIINNKIARKSPDLIASSFWCSKKNILKLKNNYDNNQLKFGRGLIFHITPSNVPTNFFYSLIFGLLSGNSNIVKVPSNKFFQIDIICKAINLALKNKKFHKIKNLIRIVRYKDNNFNKITENISKICDLRIIWGGDKTINQIREFKLKPHAHDITFSDRTSLCILDIEKMLKINKKNLSKLIRNFYNDTYIVDQNACSSPHLILWYGKGDIKIAQKKFWNELDKKVVRDYNMPDVAAIEKYDQLCKDIVLLNEYKSNAIYNQKLYTVELKKLNKNIENLRGKWGYFYEYRIKDISEIKNTISQKFQTITYFGFKKEFMKNFIAKSGNEGIDRAVPIGQALNVGLVWDGYEIISALTRKIVIT
jgi:hypothetical protein